MIIAVVGRPAVSDGSGLGRPGAVGRAVPALLPGLALGTAFAAHAQGCRRRSARSSLAWSSAKATSGIRSRTTSARSATCWSACSSSRRHADRSLGHRRRTARAARLDRRRSSPARRRSPPLVAVVLRWPASVALRVGVILAHGGEFGLLLITQAMAAGMIDAGSGPGDAGRPGTHDGPRTHPDPAERLRSRTSSGSPPAAGKSRRKRTPSGTAARRWTIMSSCAVAGGSAAWWRSCSRPRRSPTSASNRT